jgi:hypothetical protein
MVRRPAMEAVLAKHTRALLAALGAELAAVQRRFDALRRERAQLQAGRTALPPASGPALAASHLIRRITLTWGGLQELLPRALEGGRGAALAEAFTALHATLQAFVASQHAAWCADLDRGLAERMKQPLLCQAGALVSPQCMCMVAAC